MDETLRQLGELLLGAVPTVILLALLYALYTAIVHKPLRRVLEERRSKTEGAVEKSRADIAAAEARTSEYEQRLREARATVFHAQEARRKAALDARTAALNEARAQGPGAGAGREGRYPEGSCLGAGRLAGRGAGAGNGNYAARAGAGRSGTLMSWVTTAQSAIVSVRFRRR